MGALRRIAIAVKTYPNPSTTYDETVCTAGIDLDAGCFMRLYPVRFRHLSFSKQFKKWHVIEACVSPKTSDKRGDTFTPDPATISPLPALAFYKGAGKNPRADWPARNRLVLPLASDLERLLVRARCFEGSLGVVRIADDARFYMLEDDAEWSEKKLDIMLRENLLGPSLKPLMKIPWSFRYEFRCADSEDCPGHDFQVFDWEPFELCRKELHRLGSAEKARASVLNQYNVLMGPKARNVHLFVGTTIDHPTQFSCVGIYAPPL